MKTGVLKNNFHVKDYSFERTLGSVDLSTLPSEYNADLGVGVPDQVKDGYENGCTGYTQTETGMDEFGQEFEHPFVYENTLLIANLPPGSPCQMRDSFKATKVYGLKPKKGDPLQFRRGNYFDVDKVGDYFDGARSALWLNRVSRRSLSVATPWFSQWRVAKNGILKAPSKYVWSASAVGHNYKICGWKMIDNKPYLIVKPWLGKDWGDKGYGYVSREIFNNVMSISGTAMYIQVNWDGKPETVKLDILEVILSFARRILAQLPRKVSEPEIPPVAEPPPPPAKTNREKLYETAYDCLGVDMSPRENERGCAESMYYVMKKAGVPNLPKTPIYATAVFITWLEENLTEVFEPLPGDIIISPTYNWITGHMGTWGYHNIMSNNSKTHLFDDHWKKEDWVPYYTTNLTLKTRYFRWG